MFRHRAGSWNTWLCQDLDAVQGAWESRPNAETTTGILHLGFECPDTSDLEAIASRFPGDLLLTDSAKHGLPEELASSSCAIGMAANRSIHRIVGGWYSLASSPGQQRSRPPADLMPPFAFDRQWLADAIQSHPSHARVLRNAGIYDDASYYLRESHLNRDTRRTLGVFRANALGTSTVIDPCKLARAAPPWLMERDLNSLDMSVRATNIFSAMHLDTVRSLAEIKREDLFNQRNFGDTTCKVVADAILTAIKGGPLEDSETNSDNSNYRDPNQGSQSAQSTLSSTLVSALWTSFQSLPLKEAEILSRRVGFMAQIQTLAEIGSNYQLSRERVRQISAKAMKNIIQQSKWPEQIDTRVSQLQEQLTRPVDLETAESLDPWFERCTEYSNIINEFLKHAKGVSIRIIQIKDTAYFARISQQVWEELVEQSHQLICTLVNKKYASKEECKSRISALLPEISREFSECLWASISDYCHFSNEPFGHPTLCSFGDHTETYVLRVLEASEHPIHFREIARRVTELSGREANVATVQNVCHQCGLLFGSGTYGAERHFPLTENQVKSIHQLTEDIMTSAPPKRRWHTTEILDELLEIHGLEYWKIDKYLLNIALKCCSSLSQTGKMFWSLSDSESANNEDTVIGILRETGYALSIADIRAKLREITGVGKYFQLFPSHKLIQVGRSIWGLNDRDVPVPISKQPDLMNRLATALQVRQSALHISEVTTAIGSEGFPAEGLFSLATLDDRFKTASGQYVYLTEWGEPRRETLRLAIAGVLDGVNQMTIRELLAAVESRLERPIKLDNLRSALPSAGALYDKSTGTWSCAKPDQSDDV